MGTFLSWRENIIGSAASEPKLLRTHIRTPKRSPGGLGGYPQERSIVFFLGGAAPRPPVARFAQAWRHGGEEISYSVR
jgi:hypothetical protein